MELGDITAYRWCAGGLGVGVRKLADECSVKGGDGESLLSNLSPTKNIDFNFKTLTEGVMHLKILA